MYNKEKYSEPAALELDKIGISGGLIGKFWGVGEEAKQNIIALLIFATIIATVVVFIKCEQHLTDKLLPVFTSFLGIAVATVTNWLGAKNSRRHSEKEGEGR